MFFNKKVILKTRVTTQKEVIDMFLASYLEVEQLDLHSLLQEFVEVKKSVQAEIDVRLAKGEDLSEAREIEKRIEEESNLCLIHF